MDALISSRVKRLVDVRENARSRKAGFSGGALRDYLRKNGIDYVHMKGLGSPSAARSRYRQDGDFTAFAHIYESFLECHMEEIGDLLRLASERPTAIMCFESDSYKCHRSIIAARLAELGCEVENL